MFPFSLNTTFQPGCSEVNFDQDQPLSCDHWKFDRSLIHTTAVEDFEMICDHKQRKSLTQTFYMVGMLIGKIKIITREECHQNLYQGSFLFGWLSDLIGRKTTLMISLLILAVGGSLPFFVDSVVKNFFSLVAFR